MSKAQHTQSASAASRDAPPRRHAPPTATRAAEEGAQAGEAPFAPPVPLLATKLFMPHPRPDLVPRPRLLAQLDTGLRGPLTLLVTPAGWGKSSLGAAWCATIQATQDRPVAWVSLDAGDNDPVRFWTYVLTALEQAQPGVAEDALTLAARIAVFSH